MLLFCGKKAAVSDTLSCISIRYKYRYTPIRRRNRFHTHTYTIYIYKQLRDHPSAVASRLQPTGEANGRIL